MRALCMIIAALALGGCLRVPKPQSGGGQITTLGGTTGPTTVATTAPQNPQTPTETTVEKTTTREFQQDSSVEERPAHNQEAAGSNPAPAPTSHRTEAAVNPKTTPAAPASTPPGAARLLRETVHERATTKIGSAQKDTTGELATKLGNMRGVMWVGVLLLVGGPIVGWKMGWFTNGCIAGAVGFVLIILAQVVPGNEAWFGLVGLFLIPLVAFVYYRSKHDDNNRQVAP